MENERERGGVWVAGWWFATCCSLLLPIWLLGVDRTATCCGGEEKKEKRKRGERESSYGVLAAPMEMAEREEEREEERKRKNRKEKEPPFRGAVRYSLMHPAEGGLLAACMLAACMARKRWACCRWQRDEQRVGQRERWHVLLVVCICWQHDVRLQCSC